MWEIKAKEILDFVGDFTTRATRIRRFEAHPYVDGDNLAEHHHRLQRLLVCIAPYLKEEFPEEKDLVEKVSAILTLHDDDEIMVGYDVITQLKNHETRDVEEMRDFKDAISKLGEKSQEYMIPAFNAFRTKNTLADKIAKSLDNLASNQVLIEQRFGLINVNCAKFTIEYGGKVRGASKTTDALIDAQIEQIVEYRRYLRSHPKELERLLDAHYKNMDPKERARIINKAKELLEIDVLTHTWDPERTLVPLDKL